MAEYLTVYEKAMRYDRLHAYFTDPMGADVRCEECEAANQLKVIDAISHDQARLRELEVENAKLRELVREMYGYYVIGILSQCDLCDRPCDYVLDHPAASPCCYEGEPVADEHFADCMRDLGVEV